MGFERIGEVVVIVDCVFESFVEVVGMFGESV